MVIYKNYELFHHYSRTGINVSHCSMEDLRITEMIRCFLFVFLLLFGVTKGFSLVIGFVSVM